jgi:hypothetical protein
MERVLIHEAGFRHTHVSCVQVWEEEKMNSERQKQVSRKMFPTGQQHFHDTAVVWMKYPLEP